MPMSFALLAHRLDRVGIERGQEPRQHLEDGDLAAGAGVDMAEFEGDDAAADEHHALRSLALAQHLVRGDHQLRARDRQRPRLGAGGDDDMLRLDAAAGRLDRVRRNEFGALADQLDATAPQRLGKRIRDARDQVLLAVDQRRPIECRLADADAVDMGLRDLVQGMTRGDQHLLRRATPVGAGAAEIARLGHDHLHAGLARRHGDAETGIAAADNKDVAALPLHRQPSSPPLFSGARTRLAKHIATHTEHIRETRACGGVMRKAACRERRRRPAVSLST